MYKCSYDIYQRLKYERRPGQQPADYQMSSELGPFSGSLLRFSAVSPIFAFNVFPSRSNDQGEEKRVKSVGGGNSNSLGEVAWSNVPQKKVHLISREWGHSVSSLAHNFQSSNPNVLSRALIIIRNCSMKRAISLQWNTLSTSGWASITNLFPWDQLKWTITIFSFLNNSLNGSIKKKNKACRSEKHNFNWESG